MDLFVELAATNEGGDRRPVSVPRPSASGVGAALRNSYPMPPLSDEFVRLLAKLK